MPATGDTAQRLIGAARAVGHRIIVSRGWAALDLIDNTPDCIAVDDVNHDVLFPRVSAIVHHGGAGTTATATRAGIPQIVTPMFSDQFYWASRIVALGIGTMIPHTTMTEGSLTGALREVFDPAVVARARKLARQVGRDGAELAARRLEAEYEISARPGEKR